MTRIRALFLAAWPPLPVWRRLDLAVVGVAVYTAAVQFISQYLELKVPGWLGEMSVVNGILLGVLLGFRNREAYDRWWEGRKLWGQLVNDSRNLCAKAVALADPPPADRKALADLVPAFAVSLKEHLRAGRPAPHAPLVVAGRVYALLADWRKAGRLSDVTFLALDAHARGMMDVCGACERIQSSPVPLSYRALLRHGTILYIASAPWFLTGEYGYWAVAVVALLAYFLLGIELTAEDVEEPFGKDGDDLDLGRFCETIRAGAEQVLAEG